MSDAAGGAAGSITVLVTGLAVGDGQARPPVVGEHRDYFLTFQEVRTIFIDSGLYGEARWVDAVATGARRLEHTATTWWVPLSGPGWTATWLADRQVEGPARLYGYFEAAISLDSPEPVSGTVTAVRGHWADVDLDLDLDADLGPVAGEGRSRSGGLS